MGFFVALNKEPGRLNPRFHEVDSSKFQRLAVYLFFNFIFDAYDLVIDLVSFWYDYLLVLVNEALRVEARVVDTTFL